MLRYKNKVFLRLYLPAWALLLKVASVINKIAIPPNKGANDFIPDPDAPDDVLCLSAVFCTTFFFVPDDDFEDRLLILWVKIQLYSTKV